MQTISFRTLEWSVADVLHRFPQLLLDPAYQREGSVWGMSRRQLFIDSVLNGFDSPKVYLHELVPPQFGQASLHRYAVIDGRQRLEALRAFEGGDFPLAADFRLLDEDFETDPGREHDHGGAFAGLRYAELKERAPSLATST